MAITQEEIEQYLKEAFEEGKAEAASSGNLAAALHLLLEIDEAWREQRPLKNTYVPSYQSLLKLAKAVATDEEIVRARVMSDTPISTSRQ